MAWIDDRIWCHPKLVGLTDSAFRTYVHGLAYAAGMSTGGHLDRSQIRLVSVKKRDENELKNARLWDENHDGGVIIHDWQEHNGKRDARRAADRERKRLSRAVTGDLSAGHDADKHADSPQDAPQDSPQDTQARVRRTSRGQNSGPARVEGSEGSDVRTKDDVRKTPSYEAPHTSHGLAPLDYLDTLEKAETA